MLKLMLHDDPVDYSTSFDSFTGEQVLKPKFIASEIRKVSFAFDSFIGEQVLKQNICNFSPFSFKNFRLLHRRTGAETLDSLIAIQHSPFSDFRLLHRRTGAETVIGQMSSTVAGLKTFDSFTGEQVLKQIPTIANVIIR